MHIWILLGKGLASCERISAIRILEIKRGRAHGLHHQSRSASRVLQLGIRTGGRSTRRKICLLLYRLFLGQAFAPAATAPDAVSNKEENDDKTSRKNVGPATEHFFLVLRLFLCRGLGRVLSLGGG